jgi:hypothetical protein
MGWMNRYWSPGEPEQANPWDETVINAVPYVPPQAIGSSPEIPAPAVPRNVHVVPPTQSDRGK